MSLLTPPLSSIVVPPKKVPTVSAPGTPHVRRKRPLHVQSGQYRGRPIHLTATCLVSPSASGSPNNQALHLPVDVPAEIYDIKFSYNMIIPGAAASVIYLAADGASILAQLSLNDDMITNDYVPIWSFDESTNIVNEQMNGQTNVTPSPNQTYIYGEYIWHLPRPLYLRPADQINVSFQNQGQQAVSATCRVSLSGCLLEGTTDPKTRILPYVAAYPSKVFALQGVADSDQSTETELANTTDDVIHLHKLTGRVDNYVASGTYQGNHYDNSVGGGEVGIITDLGDALSVQLYAGKGTQLIPYTVNFRDLFGPARAVPLSGTLAPGDYLIAALSEAALSGFYGQANIAIVGWREVPVQ